MFLVLPVEDHRRISLSSTDTKIGHKAVGFDIVIFVHKKSGSSYPFQSTAPITSIALTGEILDLDQKLGLKTQGLLSIELA
uniref:Uncharacterized protein n=1 Tax=Oryza punctata TaxID=4537 RepID=A0A0E0K1I4_ORYPU